MFSLRMGIWAAMIVMMSATAWASEDDSATGADEADAPAAEAGSEAVPGAPERATRAEWDLDGDGEISAEEREAMVKKLQSERRERQKAHMARIMKYDVDGDGRLGAAERAAFADLLAPGHRLIERRMLAEHDTDGDGELSDEERQAILEKVREREKAIRAHLTSHFDVDEDGELSRDEARAMLDRYREQRGKALTFEKMLYDKDGNGQIMASEGEAMRQSRYLRNLPNRPDVVKAHDADEDGELSTPEYAAAIAKALEGPRVADETLLPEFDADDDGELSEAEYEAVAKAMLELNEKVRAKRAELFKQFDADGDGRVERTLEARMMIAMAGEARQGDPRPIRRQRTR